MGPEKEASKELLDDNARKFIVTSLDRTLLVGGVHYLLVTDWLEMGEKNERKLALKKYPNGEIQILNISKQTIDGNRKSEKNPIDETEYEALLGHSVRRVEKVRHEVGFVQDGVQFDLKYDEFVDSKLRVLEVDAKTDEERGAFRPGDFPAVLSEVTGDVRYYGYRVGDMLQI